MQKRTKLALAAGGIVLVLAIGTGVGIAASGDDDRPLTGSDLEQATEAALAHVGSGTVTETEAGDDGAAYGVEVRLDDDSVVEGSLNADFEVIGTAADDDASEGDEEDDD